MATYTEVTGVEASTETGKVLCLISTIGGNGTVVLTIGELRELLMWAEMKMLEVMKKKTENEIV